MATNKKSSGYFRAQQFVATLQAMLETLPSEAEVTEIDRQLQQLISFLQQVREKVNSLPTQQDANATRGALARIDELLADAQRSPALLAALGMRPAPSRSRNIQHSPEDVERAKARLAQFEMLPIDQLRVRLSALQPGELQELGSAIGIRRNARISHETLVHQVATKITNTRGYRSLREGAHEEHSSGRQKDD